MKTSACKISPGCYIPEGNNIIWGPKNTMLDCKDWCRQYATCKGWTFSFPMKYCWLKLNANVWCPSDVENSSWITGTRDCGAEDLSPYQDLVI